MKGLSRLHFVPVGDAVIVPGGEQVERPSVYLAWGEPSRSRAGGKCLWLEEQIVSGSRTEPAGQRALSRGAKGPP